MNIMRSNAAPARRLRALRNRVVAVSAISLALYACVATAGGPDASSPQTNGLNPTSVATATEGEMLFKPRCGACHSTERGTPSPVGPTLAGVVGRRAASVKRFNYSKPMKALGKVWTPDILDKYLQNPAALVPGNRMAFAGLSDANQRDLIIQYLKTLK